MMTCNNFSKQLALLRDPSELSKEMHKHLKGCSNCQAHYDQAVTLMQWIKEEKSLKVSPYLKTHVAARLETPTHNGWYLKPAMLRIFSVVIFIFGIFTASLWDKSSQIDATQVISYDYYFQKSPGIQFEENWLNPSDYEK